MQAGLARAAFERALRRDETSMVASLDFADDLRASGDDAAAETLLRKTGALYPESADPHFALGMLLVRRRELAAGVSELGRASVLAPNNSHYAYAYGVGLHSTQQDGRAVATLSEARARFPDNAPIEAAPARALRRRRGPRSRLPVSQPWQPCRRDLTRSPVTVVVGTRGDGEGGGSAGGEPQRILGTVIDFAHWK